MVSFKISITDFNIVQTLILAIKNFKALFTSYCMCRTRFIKLFSFMFPISLALPFVEYHNICFYTNLNDT